MSESNYKIKITDSSYSFQIIDFEIISKLDEGDFGDLFGDGHWTFDTLQEAKDEAIRYLDEQYYDRVNNTNDPIKPKSLIRNLRLCDLWDKFWDGYEKDQKRLEYLMKDMSYEDLEKLDNDIELSEGGTK